MATDDDACSDKKVERPSQAVEKVERPSQAVEKVERPSQAVDKVVRPSQAVDKVVRPASERRGDLACEPHNCQACDQTKPPQYSFEQLAGGCATIQIVFEGREYCLRRTRAGKLVLNK